MSENRPVPVWTIGTDQEKAERATMLLADNAEGLTAERLDQLRQALSAFADTPIVTLEAHAVTPESEQRSKTGMLLDSASPLAQHLGDLITRTGRAMPQISQQAGLGGETLYRMVLPAKVAAQMGEGLVKSMPSKAVAKGVYGAVTSKTGIVAQASFVPVTAAETGAAGTIVAGAGAAGVAGAVTVAAPLVLLVIAAAASAHAEQERRRAIERLTELVEKLHEDRLDDERNRLDGCVPAIEKATAIVLDEGRVGHSLGLDSAASVIDTAVAAARRRTDRWRDDLAKVQSDGADESALEQAFPGITKPEGEFRAHLRLAALAIALKRRIVVLQALEHAQQSPGNDFPRFVSSLRRDQEAADNLEADIRQLLVDLSRVQLHASRKITERLITRGEADGLLRTMRTLHELPQTEFVETGSASDVEVELMRNSNGSVVVLPPRRIA